MATLPRLRPPTRLPTGPKGLRRPVVRTGGPGDPPSGFLRPTTSATEWMVYWALSKVFKNPEDPRRGPFVGGPPDWAYQQGQGGDGTRSVPDFVIYRPTRIVLRVQTEFRHVFTDNQKQTYDRMQRINQERAGFRVVDIFDQAFVTDKTGQAVIVVCKAALGLLQQVDPILAGTALRGSRQGRGG